MASEGTFSLNITENFPAKKLKKGFQAAAEFALHQVAERLLSDSRIFVPVLTGALKDSGKIVEQPSFGDAVEAVRVTYDLRYAEKQHEEEFRHPSLGFFGAAKYLTKPLEQFGDFYLRLYTFEFERFVAQNGLV